MTRAQAAVQLAVRMANDPAHGYDQAQRWGPDYDCSSFIISVWEQIGVKLRSAGAGYTGNMRGPALRLGFADVTAKVNLQTGSGLQPGDLLINFASHAAMYVGGGQLVHASINERSGITGGQTGDQTGREICVRSYYNHPWDCVLRYAGDEDTGSAPELDTPTAPATPTTPVKPVQLFAVQLPLLRQGDRGGAVIALQGILIALGYNCGPDGADGVFGGNTAAALLEYQADHGLTEDAVFGPETCKSMFTGGA